MDTKSEIGARIYESVRKIQIGDNRAINENANKDSDTFYTNRDLVAGATEKEIGLEMLPKNVSKAHLNGDIHFHDLDYHPYNPMTNCCVIDIAGMQKNGFKIGAADIDSPKSIQTATAQIAQIIANVSSSQYGGCTIDRIDEILAPYAELNFQKHLADAREWIAKTKQVKFAETKTTKDIFDAMQSLEYEINTLFTSNGQTPFVSVGFGLGEGKWAREIQKSILKIRIKGLGKDGRTAIFPKLLFTIKEGLNRTKNDPNYDIKKLALECSAKRMYPDILNYDKLVEITGDFKAPMGCRSFLPAYIDPETGENEISGRMNLGVVTLNLPRIALESDGNIKKFWKILDEKLKIIHEATTYRINRCLEATPKNAPILYQNGAFGRYLEPEEKVEELFKNGRSTVSLGYIGLYEVGASFFGADWEKNKEAKKFTVDILKYLSDKAADWSELNGFKYSVYSTPSESLTDRFCRMDREKFGEISDITDKDYYTNSFHYDVRKKPTPFEKIDFESEYLPFCTGGFINYCEYPVMQQNLPALEAVWDYSYSRVGYFGTNAPIDKCYACGFEGEFDPTERGFECPDCQNSDPALCDVVKRTCGYLGNPQARPMVFGRHKEISAREKHLRKNAQA